MSLRTNKSMNEILDDAFSLTDEVFITEFGSDATVQKQSRVQTWSNPPYCRRNATSDWEEPHTPF